MENGCVACQSTREAAALTRQRVQRQVSARHWLFVSVITLTVTMILLSIVLVTGHRQGRLLNIVLTVMAATVVWVVKSINRSHRVDIDVVSSLQTMYRTVEPDGTIHDHAEPPLFKDGKTIYFLGHGETCPLYVQTTLLAINLIKLTAEVDQFVDGELLRVAKSWRISVDRDLDSVTFVSTIGPMSLPDEKLVWLKDYSRTTVRSLGDYLDIVTRYNSVRDHLDNALITARHDEWKTEEARNLQDTNLTLKSQRDALGSGVAALVLTTSNVKPSAIPGKWLTTILRRIISSAGIDPDSDDGMFIFADTQAMRQEMFIDFTTKHGRRVLKTPAPVPTA